MLESRIGEVGKHRDKNEPGTSWFKMKLSAERYRETKGNYEGTNEKTKSNPNTFPSTKNRK